MKGNRFAKAHVYFLDIHCEGKPSVYQSAAKPKHRVNEAGQNINCQGKMSHQWSMVRFKHGLFILLCQLNVAL